MSKVTFLDKISKIITSTPDINKVRASDLNELKASINALYNKTGWAYYQDSVASTTQITTAWTKITIDKAGADNDEEYLPLSIRETGTLWDSVDNKITPIALGDSYEQRFDFTVNTKASNPTSIEFAIDIGGQLTPTNIIGRRFVTSEKAVPFSTNYDFPLYVKNTFLTNGAQIFARTDTGTVTIGARALFLERKHAEV